MGDRSWMQVTIHRCPTRRRQVSTLISGYVELGDATEAKDGLAYEAEEISLGSAEELTGKLIKLAPRCSFTAVQDAHYTAPGDVHHYTPELGRFDGEIASGTDVLLSHDQASSILTQGAVWGMTMLEVAFEVAYGEPWNAQIAGTSVASARRRAWLAVIDHQYAKRTEDLIRRVAGFSADLTNLVGEDAFPVELAVQTLRDYAGPRDLLALARALDGIVGSLEIARRDGKLKAPSLYLAFTAAALSDLIRDLYEGRRRP